jgi:hypothetical protein
MCEPTTLLAISAGISALSATAGHMATSRQAKAEDAATKSAYAMDQMQLSERYEQQNQELNQQQNERTRAAMVERGRLNAAYSEGGLQGGSLDRIVNTNEFNLGQDIATMNANRSNLTKQTRMEGIGLRATAQSRLNQIKRPSFLDTGLKIAGAAVDYKTGKNAL